MFLFDVCSAFLHADEGAETYVYPPKQCNSRGMAKSSTALWKLLRSLCGRRTAGSNFRDWFEEAMKAYGFLRGSSEPALCYHPEKKLTCTHHVDDGRCIGPVKELKEFQEYLRTTMLVKMSDLVLPGTSSAHLGDMKVRGIDCFYTVPDKKYAESVWEALGLTPDKMEKTKDLATPAIKRDYTDKELEPLDEEGARSASISIGSGFDDLLDEEQVRLALQHEGACPRHVCPEARRLDGGYSSGEALVVH